MPARGYLEQAALYFPFAKNRKAEGYRKVAVNMEVILSRSVHASF